MTAPAALPLIVGFLELTAPPTASLALGDAALIVAELIHGKRCDVPTFLRLR